MATPHKDFPQLFVLDHPLIQHKLSIMRDKTTSTTSFRQLLKEIALLMGYELTRNLPMTTKEIETPITTFDAPTIAGRKVKPAANRRPVPPVGSLQEGARACLRPSP